MKKRALDYLMRNERQNIPAIEALWRGAQVALCENGGVVLYEPHNNIYFVSVGDNALLAGLSWHDDAEAIALREHNIDEMAKILRAKLVRVCRQMVFAGDPPVCKPVEGLEVKPLGPRHIDFLCAHYSMGLERDYLLERLESGNVFGAYLYGELSGFVGRHLEGSIGMLEVLPDSKRRGVGTALACFMIRRILAAGGTPYAHIIANNEASIAMLGRIEGAHVLDERVAWIE